MLSRLYDSLSQDLSAFPASTQKYQAASIIVLDFQVVPVQSRKRYNNKNNSIYHQTRGSPS